MGRRKGSGGSRTGTPGTAYTNRTDLAAHTPVPFKSTEYGSGVQQQAQIAAAPATQQPGTLPFGGQHPVPPGVPAPGQFPPLLAPSERPGEPLTHGMPFGAGSNALPQTFRPDPIVQAVAALANVPAVHQTPMLKTLAAAATASAANATNPAFVQGNQ